jgi:hypothetical protein
MEDQKLEPINLDDAFEPENTLQESFGKMIDIITKAFKEGGNVSPGVFLIGRDHVHNKYKVGVFTMAAKNREEMSILTYMIKTIITKMQTEEFKKYDSETTLVAVIKFSTAHMSVVEKTGDVIGPDGKIKKEIAESSPRHDKDVLLFEMEEPFIKTTKIFEFIESEDGDVVVNEKPYMDQKSMYNEIEAKNSSLSFLFTRGQSVVN